MRGLLLALLSVACTSPPSELDVGGERPPEDEPDAAADTPGTIRFVMMGDTGTGSDDQRAVAAAVAGHCARHGCDFVVLLGDNLYDDGADGVDDPVWQERFERPYAAIDLPFHAILGNHDYGEGGTDVARPDSQVAYTTVSTKWRMPARRYTLREGPVGFVMLDTNAVHLGVGDQPAWLPDALAELEDAPWVIAAGHHPLLSNGDHGSAFEDSEPVAELLVEQVCGRVDLYVSGHDHDREWFPAGPACVGTELVVSGAGGSVWEIPRDDYPVRWSDGTAPGFFYVIADEARLTGQFVDADGTVAFEHTISR